MASAGDNSGGRSRPRPGSRVIRIPLIRTRGGAVPGQRITISLPLQGQGGQRPQIRIVQLPQQQNGAGRGGGEEAVARALREQEEAARRAAEDNHRRAQLRTVLSAIQPPVVEYSEEECVVRVSWQPVVVAGGNDVEYTVSGWKDGAGEPITVYRGQLTSCVVTTETLCRGHTHQLAVCASASGETGEQSQRSEVEVPSLAPDQPLPPKIASRTKNALGLRWNAPASNGSTISEYSLEWDQSKGEFTELFVGKAKQFKFNHKFQPGSQTLFRVRARNSVGWSDYSDEMTHNVGQAAPGVPPSPSLSSQTSQSLTLNWTPPPGPAPVSSFCLEMDDPNTGYGFCPVYQGDGLSYTCRGLQRVTVYSFRLTATNSAGTSPTSPPVSFTTLPESPGQPGVIGLRDRPRSMSLNLEWSPPTNDGGSDIESYILQVDDGEGGDLRDAYKGSEINFRLDSLSPGKNYRCRVCAVSSGGQGAWSNEALFQTPPTLPRPPSEVRVSGKVTQGSAVITWGRPTSDGGSAITCYEIQHREREGEGGEWVAAGTVAEQLTFSPSVASSLTHTLTHLTPGTQYTVRISCRNAVGLSEWSDCVSFTTSPGPPSPPDLPSITTITAHSAQLHWESSAEFGSAVSGYEVEWGPVGGARHTKPLPHSPYVTSLTQLSPDTQHMARIKALSEAGHSDWSPSVTFTTSPSTPSPPSHLALVSAMPTSLLVAWSVPPSPGSPLTQYHIHLVPPPTPNSAHLVIPPSETQASLDSLLPNTQYTVRVQAENGVGIGPLSSPLSSVTLPPPPLPPPLSLVSCTSNTLRVSWGKKTSKNVTYTLQLAPESGRFHTVYTGDAVTHKLQRLLPASRYTLRVAATSLSGQGAWSDLLTCETLPPGPGVPSDLVIRQEDDVIVMSWDEVEHSHPVTYELQLKLGGQDFVQVYRGSSPSNTHQITTYTRHQARVRACTSCMANSRKEQLFSGFSNTATCECIPVTSDDITTQSHDANNDATATGDSPPQEGVWSKHSLLILFVGVSIAVVVVAILFGQLLVAS